VRGRENTAMARYQPLEELFPQEESMSSTIKRYGVYAGFGVAGLALLAFVMFGIKERYFTIEVSNAYVDAPVVQVRAPIAGRLISALQPGEPLVVGSLLGTIYGADGASVTLQSPCDCEVLQRIGTSGQQFQLGDPLAMLIETGRPLLIRVQLPLEDVERLQVGDRAEIRLPGQSELQFGQIERINLKPHLEVLDADAGGLPISRRLAQILIRPDQPLQAEDYGSLASVRFL
jgi:HlyD family secretion protein